jgi:hypothetical protein
MMLTEHNLFKDNAMFTDPQTVTINAVPYTLPRVSSDVNAGAFRTGDGAITYSIANTYGKRWRRTARIVHSKYAADPLFPANNAPYSMTFYVVVDVPKVGYTVAEQKQVIDGFLANLQASSGANITKLLGGEN